MLRRVALAALALVAVLLPLRKLPERVATTVGDERAIRLQNLNQQLSDAYVRWTATAEHDSALAVLERSGSRDSTPRVWLSGFPGTMRASRSEAAVRRLWDRLGRADSTVRVTLFIYNQASYVDRAWRGTYSGDLITARNGNIWCIAIARSRRSQIGRAHV